MLLGRSGKFVSHRDLTEFFNTLLGVMHVDESLGDVGPTELH